MYLVSCQCFWWPYDLIHFLFVERARKNRGRLANTPCLFSASYQEPDDIDLAPEVHEEDEPEEYFAPTTAGEAINFWPWVNKVRMRFRAS